MFLCLVDATCSYVSLPHAYVWVKSQGSYHSPHLDLRPLPGQANLSGALARHYYLHFTSRSSLEEACSKVQILLLFCHQTVPYFPAHSLSLRSQFGPQLATQIRYHLHYIEIFINIREIHSALHIHVLPLTNQWMSSCVGAGESEEETLELHPCCHNQSTTCPDSFCAYASTQTF